ncbi:MAG: septum formation family protein [Propionibacteriaceae bacterium]|nr:septum formation family protein [Propionibacteriaceae bacterium]
MRIRIALATASAALLALSMAGCSMFGGGTDPDRDAGGQVTAAGDADVTAMKVGDCVVTSKIGDNSEVTSVPTVPCSEAHDGEVIALVDTSDQVGDIFTQTAVDDAAEQTCGLAMDDYVGQYWTAALEGNLTYMWLAPLEDGWNSGRDRETICIAMSADGSLAFTSTLSGVGETAPVEASTPAETTPVASSFAVGQCYMMDSIQLIASGLNGSPISCDSPHDAEVTALVDTSATVGATWTSDAIEAAADTACTDAVASYVGPHWYEIQDGNVGYNYVTPVEDGWNAGDHQTVCLAQTVNGEASFTSSLAGLGN